MTRTRLRDRLLPTYTRGEEIFHMVSHIVGGGIGVIALVLCVVIAAIKGNIYGIVGGAIYGISLIVLYTMSSIYHGLRHPTAKKVLQILDHCTIYFLIAGTYTPILFCAIRLVSPVWCWVLFGLVWGVTALGVTFTAIDLKKYAALSMICYIGMGWCVVLAAKVTIQAIALPGLLLLLGGGIAYTVGTILYGLGRTRRWMHALFHLFVVLGSILQLLCILLYVL